MRIGVDRPIQKNVRLLELLLHRENPPEAGQIRGIVGRKFHGLAQFSFSTHKIAHLHITNSLFRVVLWAGFLHGSGAETRASEQSRNQHRYETALHSRDYRTGEEHADYEVQARGEV